MATLNPTVMPAANGTLTASKATIHTVSALKNDLAIYVIFVNTSTSEEVVYPFLNPAGGTSLALQQATLESKLSGEESGGSAVYGPYKLGPADLIEAYASTTAVVNYHILYAQETQ